MEEQKKKIKDLTAEERREYNRVQKQQSRERERQEAAANRIPTANEFRMPEVKQKVLDQNANEMLKTIHAELPDHNFVTQAKYLIEATASVLFGLENNILQKVQQPHGMLVGGHFPDAVASTAIEHVHRFPILLGSATFKTTYEKFLQAVVKWDGKYQHAYSRPELMADVRAELAGTYVLKTLAPVEAAASPAPIEPPETMPSDEEIRERGRMQLLNQLRIQDPSIPPQAQHFLEHGR